MMKKSLLLSLTLAGVSALAVQPTVKYGQIKTSGPATAEEVAAAKAEFDAGKTKPDWARVEVVGGDDATIEALVAAFPEAKLFSIDKTTKFTTLEPLTKLQKVQTISLHYCNVEDLAPIGKIGTVTEVDLYGATVKDFSPLASCPKLKTVNYYAVRVDQSVFDTLAALKQVKVFKGGLSSMTSLAWLKDHSNAEEVEVFSENISDFSPISTLANLKRFRGWNMNERKLTGNGTSFIVPAVGDLAFLASCKKLERLELPGSSFSNTAALSGLSELKTIVLTSPIKDVDLGFVKTLPKLETLTVEGGRKDPVKVLNSEALAGHPALRDLALVNVQGATIAGLETCPKLKNVRLSKDAFPVADTDKLQAALQAQVKGAKVNLR